MHNSQATPALLVILATLSLSVAVADTKDTLDSIRSKRNARKSTSAPRTPVPPSRSRPAPPGKSAKAPAKSSVAPTLVVAPLGGTPYRTLTAALKAAKPGSRIRVRSGVYTESLVLDRPVEIVPDQFDPGGIIVEGVAGPALRLNTSAASVQGLTFRLRADNRSDYCVEGAQGRLNLDDCEVTSGIQAALSFRGDRTTAAVTRCRIKGSLGDGVRAADGAQPAFTDCEIIDNSGAGVRASTGARPILQTCILRKNRAQGICSADRSTATLAQCDVLENAAEGVLVEKEGRATLRGGTVKGNGSTGVLSRAKAELVLEGVTVTANVVGVEVHDSSVATITDCRIVNHPHNGLAFRSQSKGRVERTEVGKCGWHGITAETGADPVIRNCSSRENNATALLVNEGAKGIYEDCDFANGHDWSCVVILRQSEPVLRRCKIRNSDRGGLEVGDGAHAVFEGVEVFENAWSGVSLYRKAESLMKGCTVRNNQHWGLYVFEDGKGTLENCDVRANGRGSVSVPSANQPTIRDSRIQ